MSIKKAIVEIDIPSDYIDDYKKWQFDGGLYYLEDGAWTYLKDIECELKPTVKAIPIEWINDWYWNNPDVCCDKHVAIWFAKLLNDWRKENEKDSE